MIIKRSIFCHKKTIVVLKNTTKTYTTKKKAKLVIFLKNCPRMIRGKNGLISNNKQKKTRKGHSWGRYFKINGRTKFLTKMMRKIACMISVDSNSKGIRWIFNWWKQKTSVKSSKIIPITDAIANMTSRLHYMNMTYQRMNKNTVNIEVMKKRRERLEQP